MSVYSAGTGAQGAVVTSSAAAVVVADGPESVHLSKQVTARRSIAAPSEP
jgi:hypothetical protein